MEGRVIIPKAYIANVDLPLIFLAGPIRGAPNWQDEAIKFILSQSPDTAIASPRRGIRESIAPYIAPGKDNYFFRQRIWELNHLDLAGYNINRKSVIMFWLPGEVEHKCDKAYGAMTRIELGEVMAHHKLSNKSTRFCIGTDGNFSEWDTINCDLSFYASDKKVFNSLEETCSEAIKLANQQR